MVKLLFLTFARARGCRTKPEQALSSRSHWAFCSSVSRMFVQTQLSLFLTVLLSESRSSKILSVCEHVQHAAPPPPPPPIHLPCPQPALHFLPLHSHFVCRVHQHTLSLSPARFLFCFCFYHGCCNAPAEAFLESAPLAKLATNS